MNCKRANFGENFYTVPYPDPNPSMPGTKIMLISISPYVHTTMLLTLNPGVPHPPLFPIVMSLRPWNPLEYRKGLRNPKDGRPAFKRTSFNRATNPVKAGEEADVPPIRKACPSINTLNKLDCAETSGIA